MADILKIGDKITFNHQPSLIEKIKTLFGHKIPELDYYTVVSEYHGEGYTQRIEQDAC